MKDTEPSSYWSAESTRHRSLELIHMTLRPGLDDELASDIRFIDIGKILTALRRQLPVLLAGALLGACFGVGYLLLAPRSYVSSARS